MERHPLLQQLLQLMARVTSVGMVQSSRRGRRRGWVCVWVVPAAAMVTARRVTVCSVRQRLAAVVLMVPRVWAACGV